MHTARLIGAMEGKRDPPSRMHGWEPAKKAPRWSQEPEEPEKPDSKSPDQSDLCSSGASRSGSRSEPDSKSPDSMLEEAFVLRRSLPIRIPIRIPMGVPAGEPPAPASPPRSRSRSPPGIQPRWDRTPSPEPVTLWSADGTYRGPKRHSEGPGEGEPLPKYLRRCPSPVPFVPQGASAQGGFQPPSGMSAADPSCEEAYKAYLYSLPAGHPRNVAWRETMPRVPLSVTGRGPLSPMPPLRRQPQPTWVDRRLVEA